MNQTSKLLLLLTIFLILVPLKSRADEGMWLPLLLKDQRYSHMRKLGLKLSPEEIYSVNQACVKDAVIGLMGEGANLRSFGTASFVSDSGLIVTNYHVVMSYIERFSNEKNDFLKYGYWARSRSEESLCRGLQMKQLIRMEDVTSEILEGTDNLSGRELQNKINENGKRIAERETKGTRYEVRMQALFGNSQYIMNVYAVYRDIRMVAAPPFAIGKFGGNTDNYKWPRHTGDFAFLRVYSDNQNRPASYSKRNRAYNPPHFLPVSSKGVKEGEFVMIAGYPGSTRQYIPSFALEKIIYGENLHKIAIREEKMNILNNAISENPSLKYRYTTKLSSVGNSYLRWKGELMGVTRTGLVEQKRNEEAEFNKWASANPQRAEKYGTILSRMEEHYSNVAEYNLALAYFEEAGLNGAEIVPFIGKFEKLAAMYSHKNVNLESAAREASRLEALTEQFFNNWDYEVDRRMFRNLMVRYYQLLPEKFKPEAMVRYLTQYDGDAELLSKEVFEGSIFTDKQKLIEFLKDPRRDVQARIKEDALYQLAIGYYMVNVNTIARQRMALQAELMELNNVYIKGLMEMKGKAELYPDANNSQRISYGTVSGSVAQDGLVYKPFTTLDGAMDKYQSNQSNEEFYLPKKIQELHSKKMYGQYQDTEGNLYLNFLTNAHTTSGSSGSPVINGEGELVGLNFDRIWEGVASDYRYDPNLSRSIAVDMRYILFVMENYAPSDYVINELVIK